MDIMDRTIFDRLALKYKILEQIKYEDYEVKIWIMSHMDRENIIDVQGFGKFACKSFMEKGKGYADLIKVVNFLKNAQVLFIPDERAHIIQYRFVGESQYEFQRLMLDVEKVIHNKDKTELAELFNDCINKEGGSGFFAGNKIEHFRNIKQDNSKIKSFLYNFLNSNATSFANFVLKLLIEYDPK